MLDWQSWAQLGSLIPAGLREEFVEVNSNAPTVSRHEIAINVPLDQAQPDEREAEVGRHARFEQAEANRHRSRRPTVLGNVGKG